MKSSVERPIGEKQQEVTLTCTIQDAVRKREACSVGNMRRFPCRAYIERSELRKHQMMLRHLPLPDNRGISLPLSVTRSNKYRYYRELVLRKRGIPSSAVRGMQSHHI